MVCTPSCSEKAALAVRPVTAQDFGTAWPLTVDSGTVECCRGEVAGTHIVVFRTKGGVLYALNGTAKARGYPGIHPIWRDDPEDSRLKVDPGRLIALGLRAWAEDYGE